jgi:type IV pilus assembly protein PilQ
MKNKAAHCRLLILAVISFVMPVLSQISAAQELLNQADSVFADTTVSGGQLLTPSTGPSADASTDRAEESLAQLDTSPSTSDATPPSSECRVTNSFFDTDLREVLNTISTQCGLTIVADETVTGLITTDLVDVPLEEALHRILMPFGLTYRWMGTYYLVGSPRPDNPSFPYLTVTELYRPSYIKAEDVPNLLSTHYESFLRIDKATNTLSLNGSPELIARIRRDLAVVDRAPRQVMIEALVTEMSSDVSRQLGVSWDLNGSKGAGQKLQVGGLSGRNGSVDTSFSVVFDRIGIQRSGWLGNYQIRLNALVTEGKAHIRANPRIATVEGNKARIFIGREEYFSILSGSVSFAYAQLEVIKTGIILTITPYVSEDSMITLEVEPEVSDVIGSGVTGLPVTNKRSVTTKVRVNNGETVVIGGLLVKNRVENVRKIPLLGSIPILGYLFRHTSTSVEEKEISILITPRLWTTMAENK